MHLVRYMKRSASESKPFQSSSNGEIPCRARREEQLSRSKFKQAFPTDSDAELFMCLIQCIRLGSYKVRRLNRAFCFFLFSTSSYVPSRCLCRDQCCSQRVSLVGTNHRHFLFFVSWPVSSRYYIIWKSEAAETFSAHAISWYNIRNLTS